MRKLIYNVTDGDERYTLEFITNRTTEWTEQQYTRHRINCRMELISNETTEEKKPLSREVGLG